MRYEVQLDIYVNKKKYSPNKHGPVRWRRARNLRLLAERWLRGDLAGGVGVGRRSASATELGVGDAGCAAGSAEGLGGHWWGPWVG